MWQQHDHRATPASPVTRPGHAGGERQRHRHRQPGSVLGGGGAVMAINKDTGALLWKTQVETPPGRDHHAVRHGLRRRGLRRCRPRRRNCSLGIGSYICCTFRGSMAALDLATGRILWKTWMTPGRLPGQRGVGQLARHRHQAGLGLRRDGQQLRRAGRRAPVCHRPPGRSGRRRQRACRQTTYFDSIMAARPAHRRGQVGDPSAALRRVDRCVHLRVPSNCPAPSGPDYDFGQAPALFTRSRWPARRETSSVQGRRAATTGRSTPSTGAVVWKTPGRAGRHGRWAPVGIGRRRQAGLHRQRQQQPGALEPGLDDRRCGRRSTRRPASVIWETRPTVTAAARPAP